MKYYERVERVIRELGYRPDPEIKAFPNKHVFRWGDVVVVLEEAVVDCTIVEVYNNPDQYLTSDCGMDLVVDDKGVLINGLSVANIRWDEPHNLDILAAICKACRS